MGRAVGDFFGLTVESQHGSGNTMGWQNITEIRAAEVCLLHSGAKRLNAFVV